MQIYKEIKYYPLNFLSYVAKLFDSEYDENESIDFKLRGYQNLYKIKLRSAGYRLVYEVNDNQIYILVLSVGKRDRLDAYKNAEFRQAQ